MGTVEELHFFIPELVHFSSCLLNSSISKLTILGILSLVHENNGIKIMLKYTYIYISCGILLINFLVLYLELF